MPKLLHVGCGYPGRPVPPEFADYEQIRCDVDAAVAPDLLGSLTALPLADASVEAVYACHVLEHLEPWEVATGLAELYRVLRPGGRGIILVPDLVAWARNIIAQPERVEDLQEIPLSGPISVLDALYGYQPDVQAGRDGMRHRTMFTQYTLGRHLLRAGFAGRVYANDYQLCAVFSKAPEVISDGNENS